MTTKELIIEMLYKINGVNGITRTDEEIQERAESLWKKVCEETKDEVNRGKRE